MDPENLEDINDVTIGFTNDQTLKRLENEGEISKSQRQEFMHAVLEFYVQTVKYVIKTFPFNDHLLLHAKFINFDQTLDSSFESVEYFVNIFPKVLQFTARDMDNLKEEFKDYQLLPDLPDDVIKEAKFYFELEDGTHQKLLRMDVIWEMYIQ